MPNCKKKPIKLAQSWSESLQEDLKKAKQERQLFLRRQGIVIWCFPNSNFKQLESGWHLHSKLQPMPVVRPADPVMTQLSQQQQQNLQKSGSDCLSWPASFGVVERHILGFPHTRLIQV